MSTFLQLCVHARRECRIAGTGPAAVTSQVGELERLVNWVANAYTEIQNKHPNWRWLRSSFTVNTVASDDTYAYGDLTDTGTSSPITRLSSFLPNEFKIYLTSAGVGTQHWLSYWQWDDFRRVYRIGTQNDGYPAVVTIDPANQVVLGAKPDAIYTVTGDYQKSAQILAADGDTPEMPSQFHYLIVYEAVRKYAAEVGDPGLWAAMKDEAAQMWRDLRQNQLPPSNYGNPLA